MTGEKPGKNKVVAFDFDGTLLDSMGRHADVAVAAILKNWEIDEKTARERYLATSGLTYAEQMEAMFPGSEHEKARNLCIEEYFRNAYVEVWPKSPLFPDTIEILNRLNDEGFILGVASSTRERIVLPHMREYDILRLVRWVCTPDTGGKRTIFERIEAMDPPVKKVYFVGDTVSDAKLGRSRGAMTFLRLSAYMSLERARELDSIPFATLKEAVEHILSDASKS